LVIVVLLVAGFIAFRRAQGDATGSPTAGDPTSTTLGSIPPGEPPEGDRAAADLLATLVVGDEASRDGYEREAFGEGWLVGPDGCDVRDKVLAEESQVPVTRGADGCDVVAGKWLSLYDGYSTPDPTELEIDHMVPLAEAWDSGAGVWSPDRREQYANDTLRPDALVAVTAATNQSKSDRDPAEWMPPNRDGWCRYADAWITQKAAWQLTIDPAERDALRNVLTTC
jgi:hypothetical protein